MTSTNALARREPAPRDERLTPITINAVPISPPFNPSVIDPDRPPEHPAALAAMLRHALGISVPSIATTDASAAPLDYLAHAFFEGRDFAAPPPEPGSVPGAPPDCVVWANRGGGKTFLGAVATMLDLVFKPGIQVRILGGSLEQSRRMHEHLTRLFEHDALAELVADGRKGRAARSITLKNGSRAEILAASETSVRGVRVQKVRCDEVELFDPALWRAVQLTTRSMKCPGPWGRIVRGSVEALSTMHLPYGLMWELVGARAGGSGDLPASTPARRIFRWGLLDTLEQCEPEHACGACNLFEDCRGRAKDATPDRAGHLRIIDAQSQKRRVDIETWRSEMLCIEPRTHDLVYPEFDPRVHIVGLAGDGPPVDTSHDRWIAGMDFGFRAESAIVLARRRPDGTVIVEHELIARKRIVQHHLDALREVMEQYGGIGALDWLAPDPAGDGANDQTGDSNVKRIRACGITPRIRRTKIAPGLRLVRARLAPAAGPPTLLVHARCTRLIECLRRYHFKPGDERSQIPEKGEFDHACDALRYMVAGLDSRHDTRTHTW